MEKIDLLKIQKDIEEARLFMGQRLESFLLGKLKKVSQFFSKILSSKKTAFFGSLLIVAASILILSTRDIGHDSATYIEIAKKMLAGGKYYDDFFELNLPLSFWITTIPVFAAKVLHIHEVVAVIFFVNLLGILTIFYCAKILSRRFYSSNSDIFNLIILSFAAAFFLRALTSNFNEIATKSTYFLALVLPYFSYQLLENKKTSDEILSGIFAGLIFCLKPNYGILVVVFELVKLFETRDLKQSFCLRNYTTLAVLVIYFFTIFFFQNDYLTHFSLISKTYLEASHSQILNIIKEDVFPLILFAALCFFPLKKNPILWKFYLLSFAAILIVLSELIGGYDQRFIIYSLSLATLILSIFLLIKNDYFDFKRQEIWLIFLLLVSQFDAKNIFSLALDICAFWFVFVLVLKNKLKFKSHKLFWPIFTLLTFVTTALSFNPTTAFLAWAISAILFISLLYFYEQNSANRKFSLLSSAAITLVLSYFISLHIAGIFNLKSFHEIAYDYKSPNFANEQMIKISQQFSAKTEDVTVIGYIIPATYPALLYMNKENKLPSLQMAGLFERISAKKQNISDGERYLFLRLKQQLKDKNNKLIFVEVKSPIRDAQCEISFLEYYFRDEQFKKDFLENYRFLNRIIAVQSEEKEVSFYANEDEKLADQKFNRVKHDIEVYVRK